MTDYRFRFAILKAVSSPSQADEEKGSLEDQEKFARAYGLAEGGIETAGPFTVEGQPRTDYTDLSLALAEIPAIGEAVKSAEANQYDVLVVHNWDRLGELGHMLRIKFRQLKKQLKSARQSGRVHDPATYNPRADESGAIEMNFEAAVTEYRINNIVRGFEVGVDKRVNTGRYSRGFPYGYIKINEAGMLDINPPVAQLLIHLKDKFLEGLSLRALKAIADQSGVLSPTGNTEWDFMAIHGLLTNPFFAGKVFKNRWRVVGKKISASGKRYSIIRRNPNPTFYEGKHQALWTFEEYQRIMVEMEERYRKNPRSHPRAFSGLLICGVCGGVMTFKDKKYRCRKFPGHIAIREADMESGIGEALAKALQEYDEAPPLPPSLDVTEKAKAKLQVQIKKVQDDWLKDEDNRIFTDAQANEKIKELQERIARLDFNQVEHERKVAAHNRLIEVRRGMLDKLDELPVKFQTARKELTNRLLRDILESIAVGPNGECEFKFR